MYNATPIPDGALGVSAVSVPVLCLDGSVVTAA
jgi:hypothetical protein